MAEDKLEGSRGSMDLTPRGIRTHLDLNRPIYARTSSCGHFGRTPDNEGGFSARKTDLAETAQARRPDFLRNCPAYSGKHQRFSEYAFQEINRMTTAAAKPGFTDYIVKDIFARRVRPQGDLIAETEMPGLMATREEYGPKQPLRRAHRGLAA